MTRLQIADTLILTSPLLFALFLHILGPKIINDDDDDTYRKQLAIRNMVMLTIALLELKHSSDCPRNDPLWGDVGCSCELENMVDNLTLSLILHTRKIG